MVKTTSPGDPLAPLTEETLRAIAATGVVRTFPKNAMLINEGELGDALFIVLSGRVKVFASNEAGREIVLSFFGPGEYVGEMSLDGSPRSASVITVEPTSCAIVNRASFREFVLKHPDFAQHLIEKLIQRVRLATENIKSLALSDVYGRVVRLITTLAVERDGHDDRAREADAAGHRRARRRVARHDQPAAEGSGRRRLSRRCGQDDHHPEEAAARLVAPLPSSPRQRSPRLPDGSIRQRVRRRGPASDVNFRHPPRGFVRCGTMRDAGLQCTHASAIAGSGATAGIPMDRRPDIQ